MRDLSGRGPRAVGAGMLLLMAAVLFVPFATTLAKSFQAHDLAQPSRAGDPVGVANYRALVTSEPELCSSVRATLIVVSASLLQSAGAFVLALWLARLWPRRLPSLLPAVLILPMLLSPTLVGLMGRFYLNDQAGLVARLLQAGGADAPLTTVANAFFWICALDAWQWVPLEALLFWLCFQAVPHREFEAGAVDGLSDFAILRAVVLPRVGAFLAAVVLIRALAAVSLFDLPHVLTGGGPGTSTLTSSMYANRLTFAQQRFGVAAAHLVLVYAVTGILVSLLVRQAALFRAYLRGTRE